MWKNGKNYFCDVERHDEPWWNFNSDYFERPRKFRTSRKEKDAHPDVKGDA